MHGNLGTRRDPYAKSKLLQSTVLTRLWQVMDLDGTLAAGSLWARRKVRQIMEKRGALIYSTARSAELVMSTPVFELSRFAGGLKRQRPKWRLDEETGKYDFVPLELLPEFADLLDPPDAIFGFGDNVYLRQLEDGPFMADEDYERHHLDAEYYQGGMRWYDRAHALVREVAGDELLSPIDRHKYRENGANVENLLRRVQVDIRGPDAIPLKYDILSRLMEKIKGTPLDGQLEGVDESRPHEDPEKNKATLYAMHPAARKENMVNRAFLQTCRRACLQTGDVEVEIYGDALTDFASMCEAAYDAPVTGVVVGDTLAKCIEEKVNFAAVDLRHFHNALIPTDQAGVYRYENPHGHGGGSGGLREIVVGSLAYPGTIGADTILAHLEKRGGIRV